VQIFEYRFKKMRELWAHSSIVLEGNALTLGDFTFCWKKI